MLWEQRGSVMVTKGVSSRHKKDWYPGCKVIVLTMWDHGGGHVALHTVTSWALI